MTQLLLRAQARCENCDKAYRIPDPDRTYACKDCGGVVRATAETPRRHLEDAITCGQCQAINHHGTLTCVECGADLEAPSPDEAEDELEHPSRQVTSELRQAYKTMAWITWLYRLGALAYGLVTVAAVFALASADVPRAPGVLVVVLSTALTVLMLTAALQVVFKPFVWTLIVASLATVVSVVHLVGPNPLGLAFYGSAAWAVAFWVAILPTLRMRRLIAEHMDLYITHHANRRTKRALENRPARERHERLLRAMRSAFRRSWKASLIAGGLICVASVSGSYTVLAKLRPEELPVKLAQFQTAWSASNLADVVAFFPQEIQARESDRLAGNVEGHGWGDSLPALDAGTIRREDERAWVDYELPEGSFSTSWALGSQTWYLVQVELPVPKLDPTFERFLLAWEDSDAAAIASFFPYEYVDRMRESVVRSATRRSWARFPEVLGREFSNVTEKSADVALSVRGGQVTTKWRFRNDGRWHLQALQFPEI